MQQLLKTMQNRMPWHVGRQILKSRKISPSNGWDNTLQKLKSGDFRSELPQLKKALEEHLLCGQKYTKLYKISSEDHKKAINQILSVNIPESIYKEKFPYTLSPKQLEEINSEPTPVKIITNEEGVGIVYCSKIMITKREKLNLTGLIKNSESFANNYDEIIGLKYQAIQLFNIIWISHHSPIIEIRTDHPNGIPSDMAHGLHSQMRSTFNQLGLCKLYNPIDLFPLINSMYETSSEGDVVELGFLTTTSSIKHEKMRTKDTDLRKEVYHNAGKIGLGTKIEPFRLSIRWTLPNGNLDLSPELSLIGTSRGRHTKVGTNSVEITAAIINNCVGLTDYEHVLARINFHMAEIEKRTSKAA